MSSPDTRRHTPRRLSLWSATWLTAVWVLLWGSPSAVVLAGGMLMAVLVLVVFPLPRVRVRLQLQPWAFVVLVARFLADVVVASFQVAWLTVRPGPSTRGVVMDLELAGDDELLQTITAEMVALVPGTVVIDLEPSARLLTLHALDVTTARQAKAVRRRVLAQEARVLRALDPRAEQLLDPRARKEDR